MIVGEGDTAEQGHGADEGQGFGCRALHWSCSFVLYFGPLAR
jgi:hypothetical protein